MTPKQIHTFASAIEFSRPHKSLGPVNWFLAGQRAALAIPEAVPLHDQFRISRQHAPEVEVPRAKFLTGYDSILRDRVKKEHARARLPARLSIR